MEQTVEELPLKQLKAGKDPPRHLHPARPLLLAVLPNASDIKKAGVSVEDTYGLPIGWVRS